MSGASRRDFLKRLSLAPLALSYGQEPFDSDAPLGVRSSNDYDAQDRPNILLLMSDNHSWNHLGCYGDPVVRTPTVDRLAEQGVRFTHAFCAAPSCTPARAGMLSGQDIWRLEDGANLWGAFPNKFPVYTELLESAGYHVGCQGKAWGPGNVEMSGRETNHGGPRYEAFDQFLAANSANKPWTYWFSSADPHRPFVVGSGEAAGLDPGKVQMPPYLPDDEDSRRDMLDYYHEIEQFDQEVADVLQVLRSSGQEENTLIVLCSDNGWQMPRGLANLYDAGSRIPLIVSWPGRIGAGRVVEDFVNLNDLAPTFLQLAGVPVPEVMTARSFLNVLLAEGSGQVDPGRDRVYTARERHALCREYGKGYPMRGIRTRDFLYIRNDEPERWPAGDPPLYGDVDPNFFQYPGPAKMYIIAHKDDPEIRPLFDLSFAKRPAEELYDLRSDPEQMNNVAGRANYARTQMWLAAELDAYLRRTGDPRVVGGPVVFDTAMYYNGEVYTVSPGQEAMDVLGLEEEYKFFLPLSEGMNVGTGWTRSLEP